MRLNVRCLTVVVVLGLACPVAATTIIAVRSSGEVVVAADSLVSGGPDFRVKGDICKIRVVGQTVFASAGFVMNLPLRFDVYGLVAETIHPEAGVRVNADRFTKRFLGEMGRVVRWARENDGPAWDEYRRGHCFQAAFAGVEDGVPVLIVKSFTCAEDFQGRPFVVLARTSECPGDCEPGGLRYEPLGTGRPVSPPASFWRERDLAGAARSLVEEQFTASPDRVGGDVSVVRITSDGVACVECSTACAAIIGATRAQ